MVEMLAPPPNFVDNYGTTDSGDNDIFSNDDPPVLPPDVGDSDDGWWKGPDDPFFLDLFLYYGSWFIITYNSFFATVGAAVYIFAP
jgi:hypothetical protein